MAKLHIKEEHVTYLIFQSHQLKDLPCPLPQQGQEVIPPHY